MTPESDVPEFDIELRFIATKGTGEVARVTGWKYTIAWLDDEGQRNAEREYGFRTKGDAKFAAQTRCRALALAMLPRETYTYTPEF